MLSQLNELPDIKRQEIEADIDTALKIGAFDDIPQSYIEALEDESELRSLESTITTRKILGLYLTFAKRFENARDIFEEVFRQYQAEEALITRISCASNSFK